jgi:gliding motility-associated-like protein
VDVHTTAVQDERNNDNEMKNEGGQYGGSAPVTILFTSNCTNAVIHKEWQMSYDSEFTNLVLRLNQDEVEQTFEEAGTFYWRFVGSNADGSCEAISETYTVNIGVSELHCPNVFTPGTSEGSNDVWMVSYKSIVEFHCWIFNTWGNKIIELTDPSQGWDGTYGGKLVKPGVYYYVIQAKGSDGKVYKLSGDINIIRYKENPYAGSGGGEVDGGGGITE